MNLRHQIPLEVRLPGGSRKSSVWHWVVLVPRLGWIHPWYWAADMSGHGSVYHDETVSAWSSCCKRVNAWPDEEEGGSVGGGLDPLPGYSPYPLREAQGGNSHSLDFEINTAERSCGCNLLVITSPILENRAACRGPKPCSRSSH